MCANRVQPTISLSYRLSDALPLFANLQDCSSTEFDRIFDLLSHFTIFHSMPSTSASFKYGLKDLLPHLQYQVYPPGSAIYHEGVFNTKLYLILRGTVHTFIPKSYQELQDRGSGDSAGIILAKQKVISLKKLALLNNAGPRVLGKLMEEINNRKAEVQANPAKAKRNSLEKVLSSTEGYLAGKKTGKAATSNFRHSLVHVNTKAEFDEPKEARQLEKLSNMLFSRIKPNVELPAITKPNSQQDSPVESPKVEEMDELDILEELRKKLNESISESTARILRKFTGKAHKYFSEGQCLFKQFDEYEYGTYLGSINEASAPQDHSAVAITETHVLICERENFIRCFQDTIFEREQRINLFNMCLGSFIEPLELNYFLQHFTKRSYAMNEVLFYEGMLPDGLYLVYKGEVQLRKETHNIKDSDWMSPNKDQRQSIVPIRHASFQMVSLGPQQFFGEEALQEDMSRIYTAMATGWHNEVYFISIEDINLLRETCKSTLEYLNFQYRKKNNIRGKRVQVVAQANHIAQTEGELPFHQYKTLRNFDQYLKPRVRRNSLLTQPETAMGEQIALELNTAMKKRNSFHKLLKLQGIDPTTLTKESSPVRKLSQLKRNSSCDMRPEAMNSERKSISQVSRKESLNETNYYQPREEHKQQSEAKATMCGADDERESPVRKDSRNDENNTLAKIEEFVSEYRSQLKMRNRSGVLDSSIINAEVSEYYSKFATTDIDEKAQKFYRKRTLTSGIVDDLDERRERRVKDLFRSNSVLSGRESFTEYGVDQKETLVSQREYDRKESMESYIARAKKRKVHKEKITIKRNMLLYNEISSLVVQRELDEKHRIKALKKGKGSVSARQSADDKEDKYAEKQKNSLLKLKRVFAGKERRGVEERSRIRLEKAGLNDENLIKIKGILTLND